MCQRVCGRPSSTHCTQHSLDHCSVQWAKTPQHVSRPRRPACAVTYASFYEGGFWRLTTVTYDLLSLKLAHWLLLKPWNAHTNLGFVTLFFFHFDEGELIWNRHTGVLTYRLEMGRSLVSTCNPLCPYTMDCKSGVTLFMCKSLKIILYLHFA